ncbi:MAG: hypothetical protein HEQ23_15170 [Tepidisphaera sp.]
MFQRYERPATPEEIAGFRGRVRLVPTAAMVAGSLLFSLSAAGAISLVLALVRWTESVLVPKPNFLSVWIGLLAWYASIGLVGGMALAFGMALADGYWRRQRTPRRVTETVATADLAVVVWGLAEGELDALFLRVEPDLAWVVEATDFVLTPGDTTIPERTRKVVSEHGIIVMHECSGSRCSIRAVDAEQELTETVERLLDRVVPIAELPESIRRALVGAG